jgi:hypothetical protein
MKTLLVEVPINSVSFGNVSINILREFHKMNVNVGLFPIGNVDVSAFEISKEFHSWIQNAIDNRWKVLASGAPSLKLWHFSGGEDRKSSKQNLFTFYECSEPTEIELAVAKSQDKVLISSNYAKDLFKSSGCNNFQFVPLGFDESFHKTNRKYLEGVVHFGLMGKFEKRKNTGNIIKNWLKKYGNNNNYQLTCCINNPFFKPDHMSEIIKNVLDGKRYTNINFLPFLKTNAEMNELLNAIDIDLTGLSFAEGWNLPSFNATCLGKWSIVANHTAHKDWADNENSIQVECDQTIDSEDGAFFRKGSDYNQGNFWAYSDEAMINAFERAENKLVDQKENIKGLELGQKFTYKETATSILNSFE